MKLEYDDEKHEYRIDGRIVPSVTQVLSEAGLIDSSRYAAAGASRGTKVHKMIELFEAGNLNEASLDDRLRPRLEGWKKFRAEVGGALQILSVESPRGSAKWMIGGTPDIEGTWNATRCIVDLKSGAEEPWHRLQTAGYSILLGMEACLRFSLYLPDTGRYKLVPHPDRGDGAVFLSCLAVANWKANHGMRGETLKISEICDVGSL